jgi:D-alanyl-D-alanine carboxypeptidase (penicillin-binding protein 5/6)
MARSTASRINRALGITLVAILILAIGLYGPATLVGPLPSTEAEIDDASDIVPTLGAPTVSENGASAIATADGTVLASGGDGAPVPLGGVTKVITALVVLDEKPIEPGKPGPSIVVTAEDYAGYVKYISESARSISLIAGETWTEQQYLQSMLLGSSNTHADALARWAFGSVDDYVVAANAWLAKNGYAGTTVVDATGLAEGSQGTASELAALASRAFGDPVLADIMSHDSVVVAGNRRVDNVASYRDDEQITGLSRSFTDSAGLCFLFRLMVGTGDDAVPLYGAYLREPDYETLDGDLTTLISSAAATLTETVLVSEGEEVVTYTTPWGDVAHGVAVTTKSELIWLTTPVTKTVTAEPQTTAAKGTRVGQVTFNTPTGDVTVLLELDRRIADPGPVWRMTHPAPVIDAFIRSRTDSKAVRP